MPKTAKKAAKTPTSAKPSTPALTDTRTLRARARKSVEDGAITPTYTADRKQVIRLLNEALATEWVCVLRYYRHYYTAKGMLTDAVKGEFLEHAQQEMEHAGMLSERIVQLGGSPDLNPDTLSKRSHADYVDSTDLKAMIRANLVAERVAVETYRQIIQLVADKDPTTKRMLEGILEQEEEHAEELSDWLED